MNVMTAMIAGIGWTAHNAVMLGFPLAFVTEHGSIRVEAPE
jgi:hypothetical protein